MAEQKGVTEITDTFADLAGFEMFFREQLSDGKLTLPEIFQAGLQAYPLVQEVIRDFPEFRAEALDLQPGEAVEVREGVSARLGVNAQDSRVWRFLDFAADGHRDFYEVRDKLDNLKNKVIAIVA